MAALPCRGSLSYGQAAPRTSLLEPQITTRRRLIRDILLLQVKLFADAGRDLLLAPVALGAGLIDLFRPGAGLFPEVLRIGRVTDRWINLFGHSEPAGEDEPGLDQLAQRVEGRIAEHYRQRNRKT